MLRLRYWAILPRRIGPPRLADTEPLSSFAGAANVRKACRRAANRGGSVVVFEAFVKVARPAVWI